MRDILQKMRFVVILGLHSDSSCSGCIAVNFYTVCNFICPNNIVIISSSFQTTVPVRSISSAYSCDFLVRTTGGFSEYFISCDI